MVAHGRWDTVQCGVRGPERAGQTQGFLMTVRAHTPMGAACGITAKLQEQQEQL